MRFLAIPYAALEVTDLREHGAVVDLYKRAHALRWRPFKVTERSLAAKWGVSGRRVWTILERLQCADCLTISKGCKRQQTVISIVAPVKQLGQQLGQQNERVRKPDMEESEAQDEAQDEAPSYETRDKTRDFQNDADGAALPLPIARKLAAADLPTSADELARFPRSIIASADGIGAKSIATIAAWLAGHGVQFRPEPPKAAKRDSKPYTDAWLAAWTAKRSDAYPWDWFRESALLLQVAGVLGNDAARVEAAARA